jgi:tRNA(Ile)-lysidine synthase
VVVEQVRDAVRSGGLLAGSEPVLVLLSGGRDSTCLLDLAVVLCGVARVSALHVNYGLREQAGADEAHCLELCSQLGVELQVLRAGADAVAPLPAAGNVQAWARELRYRAARERAEADGGRLATGHTASDQVETILYRLCASPGRRALLGMPARDGRLVRPLLGLSREQTSTYCRERGLGWREDESNADDRYARSRVRHGLLPALRAVHPAAEANVLRTAALLREETELLEGLVDAELVQAGSEGIAVERLVALPPALARLVVVRLAERAAGTFVPQAGERVQELIALGRRGGRAELHVGGQAGAVLEDGVLTMVKLPARARGVPPGGD